MNKMITSQHLAFWMKFGRKINSQLIAKQMSNSFTFIGSLVPNVGGIFRWGVILAQPCQLSLQRVCAVHATCWLHNTKLVQSADTKSALTFQWNKSTVIRCIFLYTDLEISTHLSVCELNTVVESSTIWLIWPLYTFKFTCLSHLTFLYPQIFNHSNG